MGKDIKLWLTTSALIFMALIGTTLGINQALTIMQRPELFPAAMVGLSVMFALAGVLAI